jgi:hypothetical protein
MKPIPEVGKYYHFWDDGKKSPSRHYIVRIERILPVLDSVKTLVPYLDPDLEELVDRSLWDIWNQEKLEIDWIFSDKTDYFIEVSCPKYDKNDLWFARTKEGGWFSMNIQSSWQAGRLDVTGEIYESVIDDAKQHGWNIEAYTEETY